MSQVVRNQPRAAWLAPGQRFEAIVRLEEAGYETITAELRRLRDDRQYWVEYALDQLQTVQQVATRFDGLHVHSWPDDELVRATSGQLRTTLKTMQQAVSPEAIGDSQLATHDTPTPSLQQVR